MVVALRREALSNASVGLSESANPESLEPLPSTWVAASAAGTPCAVFRAAPSWCVASAFCAPTDGIALLLSAGESSDVANSPVGNGMGSNPLALRMSAAGLRDMPMLESLIVSLPMEKASYMAVSLAGRFSTWSGWKRLLPFQPLFLLGLGCFVASNVRRDLGTGAKSERAIVAIVAS